MQSFHSYLIHATHIDIQEFYEPILEMICYEILIFYQFKENYDLMLFNFNALNDSSFYYTTIDCLNRLVSKPLQLIY